MTIKLKDILTGNIKKLYEVNNIKEIDGRYAQEAGAYEFGNFSVNQNSGSIENPSGINENK